MSKGRWIPALQLADGLLPLADERLDLSTDTLPAREVLDAARTAQQVRKDVVALRFEFEGSTRTEAPAGLLGQLLDNLQQTVYAVGQAIQGRGTTRAPFPKDITKQMKLSVAGVFPGSFGVELHADEAADLFGESPIGKALEQFVRLLESTPSDNDLMAALSETKGRSALKYRQFLLRFAGGVKKVDVRWGSPKMNTERVVTITSAEATRAAATINRMAPEPSSEYDVTARLVGINIRTKTYEIWDVEENQKYSGRIVDKAMSTVEHATVNDVYIASIKEMTELTVTGEPDTKYHLLELREVDGNAIDEEDLGPLDD